MTNPERSALRRSLRTSTRGVLLVAVGMLTLAACGSDSTTDENTEAADGGQATEDVAETPAEQPSDQPSGDSSAAQGDVCAQVASVDLVEAFGGTLQFGEPNQYGSAEACVVPVVGAEGEGLIVQITIPGNYEAKALYEEEGLPFTTIAGLGQEAFIVNEADLNVLIDDATALNVALSAFFVGEVETPDAATLQAGLTAVAEAVLAGR